MSTALTPEQVDMYHEQGFLFVPDVLSDGEISYLRNAFADVQTDQSTRRKSAVYGLRNIIDEVPEVKILTSSSYISRLVQSVLITTSNQIPFATRGLYFDKLDGANWKLPWHQDLAIAVKEKIPTEGYVGWSEKEGVPHVIPPDHILQQRVALRFHLDDCSADNGALRVIPGTHRHGRLSHDEITELVNCQEATVCTCKAGDLLLIHPLLLHASHPAVTPTHRRVIHIEYAGTPLDAPLRWHVETGS